MTREWFRPDVELAIVIVLQKENGPLRTSEIKRRVQVACGVVDQGPGSSRDIKYRKPLQDRTFYRALKSLTGYGLLKHEKRRSPYELTSSLSYDTELITVCVADNAVAQEWGDLVSRETPYDANGKDKTMTAKDIMETLKSQARPGRIASSL